MEGTAAVIGSALHNGWGIFATVCVSAGTPTLVDCRRVELVEPNVPKQPYHHEALDLELSDAAALIERVRVSAHTAARQALQAVRDDLTPAHDIVGVVLPERSAVPSDLAEILIKRKGLYIADRELYVASVGEAARSLGLKVWTHPRKREFMFAAEATGIDAGLLRTYVDVQRKIVGAPWRRDHQTAMVSAIGVLATIGALRPDVRDWSGTA